MNTIPEIDENLLETLELLAVPGLLESIREAEREIECGDTYSMDEVFAKQDQDSDFI